MDALLRAWPADLKPEKSQDATSALQTPEEEPAPPPQIHGPELPRRLFRALSPRTDRPYTESDAPLPLLRFLYAHPRLLATPPDADAHAGYALARAVHAEFLPLITLLLARGASPAHKNGLAVLVAVRRKSLALVKVLIEREDTDVDAKTGAKRRRLADRVDVTPEMLKAAVKAKARDIAEYFMQEKGCVPDMQTLHMLMR